MLFRHSNFALPLYYEVADVAKTKLMSGYKTHFHAPPMRNYINILKPTGYVMHQQV
jgi:hypothetical protein